MVGQKRLGILTSGGDSAGMNAAIRVVVRLALHQGWEVMGIRDGFAGLVEEPGRIVPLQWSDVSRILPQGGTFLGTARCEAFKSEAGQRLAAQRLRQAGIEALVVIGGEGSFRGALALQGKGIPTVGIPATIDNDIPGTDMSIGADTALNTAMHNVDMLNDTASSHNRTFVVEVMGNRSGYLALMTGLNTGAEYSLIPEVPVTPQHLREMLEEIDEGYRQGKKHGIVVVAEGTNVKSPAVKAFIEERSQPPIEVRTTVLGHVQRGGAPSAFDRILATRLGAAAFQYVAEGRQGIMVGLRHGAITPTPLEEVVAQETAGILSNQAREAYELCKILSHPVPLREATQHIGILTAGADAPGMNATIRSLVRVALSQRLGVYGIRNGFAGLLAGGEAIFPMDWMSVNGFIHRGGSLLGTSQVGPLKEDEIQGMANTIRDLRLRGLVVIGGLGTLQAAQQLQCHPEVSIPLIVIPATIDNNLPLTDMCIGADTALNTIVRAIDNLKDTASASHSIFVIEVMGDQCGYLALMSGLAGGAEQVFIPEEGIELKELVGTVHRLRRELMAGRKSHGLIVLSAGASRLYDAHFISRVVTAEGGLEAKTTILGEVQRGGSPSAFDRILGSRMGREAVEAILAGDRSKMITLNGTDLKGVPLEGVIPPKGNKLVDELRPLERLLAQPAPA